MNARSGIEPFYFGASPQSLFGCYYAPQPGRTRDCGVVLCHPMAEEYIRAHRSYRRLALRLSGLGFHVLRFDFYGCGDSSGDFEDAQIRQWLSDISTTVDAVRGKCRVAKICLVGLRFGGTLAMLAGAERGDIDGLVLWDPVTRGSDYIEELAILQQQRLPNAATPRQERTRGKQSMEVLGFPLTESLLTELETLDLFAIQRQPAKNILVLESHEAGEKEEAARLRRRLIRLGVPVAYRHIPGPPVWLEIANRGLVPHQLLQSLVAWLSEVYS